MAQELLLDVLDEGQHSTLKFQPTNLIIAGWAGRNADAVEAHIRELEEIGVKRPRQTPTFYRLAPSLLTTSPVVTIAGAEATGEAEVVLARIAGKYYVGIGSDHTDRKLETVSVTFSKQVCAKPVGTCFWALKDIEPHWDAIELYSDIKTSSGVVAYQKGTLASLLSPRDLLAKLEAQGVPFDDGSAMMCGTVPVINDIQYSEMMRLKLNDPILGRTIEHTFAVKSLELAD